jgi:5'-AMP-activated protein kinase catalytic alpha subunit
MELEALQLVEFAYNRQRGEPRYTSFRHRGVPPRYPAFELQLPVLLLPWDAERGGVMCFTHPAHHAPLTSEAANQDESTLLGVCRCGVVRLAKYFQRGRLGASPTYDVAVKVMDKTQLKLQHDDVLNEVRVMAQLQPPGFAGLYNSPHFSQWECLADHNNEYIAMDWAANGSLIMYAKRRLTDYKRFAVERLVNRMTSLPELEHAVNAFVARAWMLEALHLFEGVLKGLAYMHAQNVCHLDVDPCNVVIDAEYNPRVIDFGSSEIMTNNGRAGADDRLIKFKPLYVAEEVRAHNQHPSPRPGFLGAPADMWSAGVLVRGSVQHLINVVRKLGRLTISCWLSCSCINCCASATPRATWRSCATPTGPPICSRTRTSRATTRVSARKAASFASAALSSPR